VKVVKEMAFEDAIEETLIARGGYTRGVTTRWERP